MNTTPIRVPVTHLDLPEDDMAKRPELVKLTPKNKVRIILSLMAFEEACGWFGDTIQVLGKGLEMAPWQALKDLDPASQVYLLLDIYQAQMEPYALSYPEKVKLTLSRTEACQLWRLWYTYGLPGSEAAALTEVMHTLHQKMS